jgi:1-deoxy-D-xylulose 5-phosphate reductoisomerase
LKKSRLEEIRKISLDHSDVQKEIKTMDMLSIIIAGIQENQLNTANLVEVTADAFLHQSQNFSEIKGLLSDINKKLDVIIDKATHSSVYEVEEVFDEVPELPESDE